MAAPGHAGERPGDAARGLREPVAVLPGHGRRGGGELRSGCLPTPCTRGGSGARKSWQCIVGSCPGAAWAAASPFDEAFARAEALAGANGTAVTEAGACGEALARAAGARALTAGGARQPGAVRAPAVRRGQGRADEAPVQRGREQEVAFRLEVRPRQSERARRAGHLQPGQRFVLLLARRLVRRHAAALRAQVRGHQLPPRRGAGEAGTAARLHRGRAAPEARQLRRVPDLQDDTDLGEGSGPPTLGGPAPLHPPHRDLRLPACEQERGRMHRELAIRQRLDPECRAEHGRPAHPLPRLHPSRVRSAARADDVPARGVRWVARPLRGCP
mmetsp:Transcript_121084/g.337931  ORF Transcript_121084/g.337931 Transcript_121084/m.337931 type:complete len:330 (+) Transcript_121084:67-1056(+)